MTTSGPTKIGIIGFAGRMGQAVATVARERPDTRLIGGLVRAGTIQLTGPISPVNEKKESPLRAEKAEDLFPLCDVLIDFSNAAATADYARAAAQSKRPFLSGTTGLGPEALEALREAAAIVPVLHATNTSLSLAVFKRLIEQAARLLKDQDYDIAIHDSHHRWKKDAPSGTALTLGQAALKGNDGAREPSYSATRAGAIVGEHTVLFAGTGGETLTLTHTITDRRVFADGAVHAALWLTRQPAGFYTMNDVLNV